MKNELAVIIKESGLEQKKGQTLLDNFAGYFEIAEEWKKKASVIIVKNASQKADMQMARVGRLFLREKRINIEKTRKELKEQSLREGKAIDGIANVLKALIVPIEEYLGKQEKFVEIKAAEIAELARVEMERKAEKDRLAKEEAERKEQERIRLENEKLKKEAIAAEAKQKELEKQAMIEREEAEKKKRILEKKAEAERISGLKIMAQAGLDRELAKKAEVEQLAKLEAERKERKKIQTKLYQQVQCPFCKKFFFPERRMDNAE